MMNKYLCTGLSLLIVASLGGAMQHENQSGKSTSKDPRELPVRKVGHFASAAEAYFSPDGQQLIVTARMEGEKNHNVYILNIDGTNVRRITDKGKDACTFFAPNGQYIVFSSTRDADKMPPGDYANSANYPAGSEVYIAHPDGSGIRRLTFNTAYEAETSFSPDGRWILYTSNVDGNLELYRMTLDGKKKVRITHTPDLQEGGAFYMPDGKHIIFRAWKKGNEGQKKRISQLYLIRDDGTELVQLTNTPYFNWSPYPHPDGKHVVFAHNETGDFEVYMLNIETRETVRLTYNPAFDSYPVISPDGKTLAFTSTREGAPAIYLMDLSPVIRSTAGGTPTFDDDVAQVRTVVLTNALAFERGDFDALANIWAHDDDVVVIESGRMEVGWEEFSQKHLKPELDLLKNVVYRLGNLHVKVRGDAAWAAFNYHFEADVGERHVTGQGTGTLVLEKRDGQWLIVQSHLSRPPRRRQQ